MKTQDKERAAIVADQRAAEQGVRDAKAALDEAQARLRDAERRWTVYQSRQRQSALASEAKRQGPIIAKERAERLARINKPIEERIRQVKQDLAIAVRCQSKPAIEDATLRLAKLEEARQQNESAVGTWLGTWNYLRGWLASA